VLAQHAQKRKRWNTVLACFLFHSTLFRHRSGEIPQCRAWSTQHRSHIDPAEFHNASLAPLSTAQTTMWRKPKCLAGATQHRSDRDLAKFRSVLLAPLSTAHISIQRNTIVPYLLHSAPLKDMAHTVHRLLHSNRKIIMPCFEVGEGIETLVTPRETVRPS
jgi:hypothetical protein